MQPPYGIEVLGKRCSIMFELPSNRVESFTGRITEFKATLVVSADAGANQDMIRRHYVTFDDGDEVWFDLESEKQQGRLKWLAEKRPLVAAAAAARVGPTTNKRKTAAEGTDNDSASEKGERPTKARKKKKAVTQESKAVATVVTPTKKPRATTKPRPQKALTKEQQARLERNAEWLEEMAHWLEHVPHGPGNKTVSAANSKSVLRQVKKLVAGQGIGYAAWPPDIIFYEDRPITDLAGTDFASMLKAAKEHEDIFGKDKGNGWLLQHPIKKLLLFQEHYANEHD